MELYKFTKSQALHAAVKRVELQAARLALTAQARLETGGEERTLRSWVADVEHLAAWLNSFPDNVEVAIIPRKDGNFYHGWKRLPCLKGGTHSTGRLSKLTLNKLARLAAISQEPSPYYCIHCSKEFTYWYAFASGFTFAISVNDPAIEPVSLPRFGFALVPQGDKTVLVAVEKSVLAQIPGAEKLLGLEAQNAP